MSDAHEHFDPAVLTNLGEELGSDADAVLVDIIEQFFKDAPASLEAIQNAVQARDAVALTAAAHRLKGQALTLGCPQVSALCATAERCARNDDLEPAIQAANALADQMATAMHYLGEFKGNLVRQ